MRHLRVSLPGESFDGMSVIAADDFAYDDPVDDAAEAAIRPACGPAQS